MDGATRNDRDLPGTGTCAQPKTGTCAKRGRFWAVTDAAGDLVCLAVYRKGAREVLRRLSLAEPSAGDSDRVPTTQ